LFPPLLIKIHFQLLPRLLLQTGDHIREIDLVSIPGNAVLVIRLDDGFFPAFSQRGEPGWARDGVRRR